MRRRSTGIYWLGVSLAVGGVTSACSSSSSHQGRSKDGGAADATPLFKLPDPADAGIFITPANPQISVNPGAPPTPTQFVVNNAGTASVQWSISNPYLGTIDANGLFTPFGQAGGGGDIVVTINGAVVAKLHITVNVNQVQNGGGAPGSDAGLSNASGDAGAGGLGGVGGEGLGGPVSSALLTALNGTPATDTAIKLLYPYDQTVFPLGILPPLYQWTSGSHGDIQAVYVHLSAPPYYDYKGYFSRPSALAAASDFLRSPIPNSAWTAATNSAAGSILNVSVVFAAGGKAYGPVTQNYKIALAPFNGRIYYQAYDTAFVKNSTAGETVIWDNTQRFGAATLSIDVGATSPKLVAGTTTNDNSGCRVCHSVSAYGDRMVVQHGNDYAATSAYDLKNGNAETTPYAEGSVGWAGMSPDGTMGLANSISVTGLTSNTGDTKLYDMKTGAVIPSPGLNAFATQIGLPAFSPDTQHVAFTFFDGPGGATIGGLNGHQLVTMGFDAATKTFSKPKKLWDAPGPDQRPAFMTFMPTSDAVVFARRWDGTNGDVFSSWYGSRSELWWVDIATGTATALNSVNGVGSDGKSYLPTGPRNHATDQTLSYEPSISPVASGGYAWLVFMSRRMYGNVITRDPWDADPRVVDIHGDDPTPKKIWMAAIDFDAKPGTDPSHPAFYIPGQELKGVNSRPFFALQPCITDNGTCQTGIDCCTGFCRDGLCSPQPQDQCSQIDEKCVTQSDCCVASAQCIGGFCAQSIH